MPDIKMVFTGYGFALTSGLYLYVVSQLGQVFVGSSREAVEKAAGKVIDQVAESIMGRPADEETWITVDGSQRSS